ncbi:Iron-sulfur cluster regulator IscR [Lachnospiraceae bacterium TWA4]|nr:Iron-sulfur cluster regulator IscR [Lachnospiraceae bacterium TWA4]
MMKISTRGRYALRLMLDLALHNTENPVRIKDIAKRQEVSSKYLEQIVSTLNKAGYVRSMRGPQGGYFLAKRPEEYTVGMILRLTEGSFSPADCVENEEACDRYEKCTTVYVWQKIQEAVDNVVDNITLQDLVEIQLANNGDYVI